MLGFINKILVFKIIAVISLLMLILILFVLLRLYYIINFKELIDRNNLIQEIDNKFQDFINKNKAVGIVVGVYKNGKTYIKGYGKVNKESNDEPNNSTIFELASTSKLFTTSVLQILNDKKIINLDDKIFELLKNKVVISDLASNVTLRHLATHTSGFPSIPKSFFLKLKDNKNPYKNLVITDLYEYLKNCQGKEIEGKYKYSNLGMGLLGHALEIKLQKNYEELIKEQLLTELEMTQTSISLNNDLKKIVAQGYSNLGEPNPIWEDKVLTGAGSFLSNADDMIKFIKANLDENYSGISKSLIKTQEKQFDGKTALGWNFKSKLDILFKNNDKMLWHSGMAGGYASFLSIDKPTNSGIIILSNKAEDVSILGMQISRLVSTQTWKQ